MIEQWSADLKKNKTKKHYRQLQIYFSYITQKLFLLKQNMFVPSVSERSRGRAPPLPLRNH